MADEVIGELLGHINAGNPDEHDRWTVWLNNDGFSRVNQNQTAPPGTVKTGSSTKHNITEAVWSEDGTKCTITAPYTNPPKPGKPGESWILKGYLEKVGEDLQACFTYAKAAAPDVILATTTPSNAQAGFEFEAP